jgi:hypothetical protein
VTRALLVLAALLLAASPALARPRHAASPKPRCAAAAHAAANARPHTRRKARACAALRHGRVHRAARALGAVSFAATPAPQRTVAGPAGPSASPTPAPPAPTPDPGPTLPPVYSNPYAIQVQAIEFGLLLSKTTVSAGNVRVEFNLSRAEDPHNLFLVRTDGTGPAYSFDEQPSGAVVAKTLRLTSGKWKLFCALPEHEGKGMRATLTVAAG